jgi:lysophospholipase L1-like esterase
MSSQNSTSVTSPPAQTARAPRRKRTLRRKILYATLCAAAAFLLAESGLRVRAWVRYGTAAPNVPDDLTILDKECGIRVPRPGAERQGSKIHISVNSLGFRGKEFDRAKPKRTVRIACLGASTTFCAEVTDDEAAWPARLQALLQERYPDVNIEVINAGIPGCVIADSIKNLTCRVLPLNPDLVIFYEANNDMALDTRALAGQRGLLEEGQSFRSPFSKLLAEHSLFYDLATKNLAVLFSRSDSKSEKLSELPSDLPRRFIEKLGEFHDALSERGIPLVLSTQLVKYRRDQPRAVQLANADVAFYYMSWMSIDALLDGMDLYNEAIVRFANDREIPVVKETASIPADAKHFVDFIHLADAGCDKMAKRFDTILFENGTLASIASEAGEQVR